MLMTDRDCRRGGRRFAIPTLGEIEGKLIASEIVATSCLHELWAHSGSKGMLSIKNRIRQALDARCTSASLCHEDSDAAVDMPWSCLMRQPKSQATRLVPPRSPVVARPSADCGA
ncbi:hypothetical protein FHX12_003337 [Rhizobium sp. BK609]|nr:hypothetical protein [Rhizobium sp. BK098]MBB3616355.1 hypothetical protein [Rhizobium sp. BK609]MBB3682014.1 hypothetical protein [Rhizobium sp. BK612]